MTLNVQRRPAGEPGGDGSGETVPTSVPHVPAQRVQVSRKGVRTVSVQCPFCNRLHVHGWPLTDGDEPAELSRVSHCVGVESRTYRIEVTTA